MTKNNQSSLGLLPATGRIPSGLFFDPEVETEVEKKEPEKKEEPQPSGRKKYKISGQEIELTDQERDDLLYLGAVKHQEMQKPADKEDKKEESKEDTSDPTKIQEYIDKSINKLRQDMTKERVQQGTREINKEIKDLEKNYNSEFEAFPTYKDAIKKLTLLELAQDGSKDVSEIYEKHAKEILGPVKKHRAGYIKDKIETKNKTEGQKGGGGSPNYKPEKPLSGDDLLKGKGIQRARELIKARKTGVYD